MCSTEDEQQTPVSPILLNNHPKPHPNHSKGHVKPLHTFLLPPFDPRLGMFIYTKTVKAMPSFQLLKSRKVSVDG